ncbi:MAG: hypothetical protein Q7T54_00725 [Candidatus Levybacteria bacterium]|nr:hypothetical protein [Candidatus Levybacteria bacterium]
MAKKKSAVVKKPVVRKADSKKAKPSKKADLAFSKIKWILWGIVTGVVVCLYFIFR